MAQVQLARLELLRGHATATVERAGEALRNAPGDPTAQLLLVRGHLAQRQFDAADQALAPLLTAFPKAPAVQVALGRLSAWRRAGRAVSRVRRSRRPPPAGPATRR